ncbi:E3 ubiquitin-protein ligase PEP5 [Mycena indigotica]|uniref:Conserved oligomeric Golgi complex subunit 6 n=1 Tax=Mycena indigotica TaxID=2126181 RepID=A0A8H6SW75_9AGAR|nr:E3 ubiquitin-protein ligase PEP5 [Mycena indigotica]KAF7306576.1 E3 ubiquitin-protein ligase PEP5 [Mycena indigotica]
MSSLPPTAPAWRNFTFFDEVPIKDAHDLNASPEIFKTAAEISTILASSTGVVVADIYGTLHIVNKEFEPQRTWAAYEGGRVTHMAERRGILVTVGEDESVRGQVLKIWDLEKKAATPPLLRSTKIQLTKPHPVCTIALSASLSHLAVGFADGTVLLYRHIDQSINNNTALLKPKTIHESPTEPITGLGFSESKFLFVVTTNRVLSYQVSGSGSSSRATVVDEVGCALGCATMDWREHAVVVAREEAIYVCNVESRGACYAYEGHKSFVRSHLNYLVIISPPTTPSAAAMHRTVRNFASRNGTDTEITRVSVFDPENKIVGYSSPFTQGVRDIISIPEWGGIYILGNDGSLKQLLEKPFSAKLEMLYRSSMFPVALNLAKTQGLEDSSETVADIHKQYGDHLYNKGNWDAAMAQFVKTIGCVAPSYVIRKFLDAQRIHNLVTYLQELHSLGRANSDHTTLLLNAYTKLKDVSRLDGFIKTESRRVTSANGEKTELPFDLDTAIRVCRQAGYFSHASYLAKKYERHEEYLRIQIEDSQNYAEALVYFRALGGEAAESNLARYGRAMLESLPEETTQLLIDLCTPSGVVLEPEEEVPNTAASTKALFSAGANGPSYLSYLALNRNSVSIDPPPPSPSIKTVKPSDTASRRDSLHESRASTPPHTPSPQISGVARKPPPLKPAHKLLSPRIYFAHFVDHLDQFVVFLETVAERRWGQSVDGIEDLSVAPDSDSRNSEMDDDKPDQVAVWNTLLELYLTLPDSTPAKTDEDEPSLLKRKALRVLKSTHLPYDPTHALILCSSHGYTRGLVLLWERMGMYEDVLRFLMASSEPNASDQVVQRLTSYGHERPHLYLVVLRYLTSTPALLTRHESDVRRVIEHIDKEHIATPLGIVQILSRNEVASVGLIKEWLISRIQSARSEIQSDKEWTTSYRLETTTKLKQVEDLSDPEHPRVFNVTRCSACGGQLDLPSVHFMCNHSFHQPRCIQESETECPLCVREHGVIREIRQNNEKLADQHDLFVSEVKEGGFAAVAGAFSRAQARNPIALRLYKVLGTNFDDETTREALYTLSELYATPVKGKDAPEEELNEEALTECVPGESAARARKNLRRDMEQKLAEGSQQFLATFAEVDQRLEELQYHVAAMHASCDEAENQLRLTSEASAMLLERAGSLSEERQEVETKKSIVSLFLGRFTLNTEEVEAMTSRDIPVGKQFFKAMDKTERIRTDCRVLMTGDEEPTRAGLDIMAATSSYLEQAYEKIVRWSSYEFLQMRDLHIEVSPIMRETIRRLRKRPELLTEALASLSETRQTTLMSSFLTALTRGGPSGLPRPIELHAHDPLRYVGDMLAWVHQAIAAEREFLESLFDLQSDGRMVGSVRVFAGKSEEEEWIKELMDHAVGKLCVPLKVRVQQTVRSQESSIISYKIANLLQFYLLTMRRTIGEAALMSTTLSEITDVAYKVFYDAIEAQGRTLSRAILDLDDPSLSPPLPILDHAQILREIMNVYDSSLLGDEGEAEQAAGFRKILDITVDPPIEMSLKGSEEKKRLRPRWDRDVYVLNCLSYLQSVMEPFSFTAEKRRSLQDLVDERVSQLTEEHYQNIMGDAGLAVVSETCAKHDKKASLCPLLPPFTFVIDRLQEPLSRIPATLPAQIQAALRAFSDWLSGLEVVQSPRLAQLTAQRLHIQIHQEALRRMAQSYGLICEQVKRPENRYEAAATLLGSERPFGQINLLWQIFGLEKD